MNSFKSRQRSIIGFVLLAATMAVFIWLFQQYVKEQRSAEQHLDAGAKFLQQGQLGPAEYRLKKALAIDPDSSGAHLRLGYLYMQQGELSLALHHLEKANQLSPEDVNIVNNLGTVYEQQGDYQRAMDQFAKAIQVKPTEPGSYNNLAWLYATCADPVHRDGEKAVSLARKACDLTGWNVFGTLDTLAAAHAQAGQFEDAVRRQTEAIDFAPEAQRGPLHQRLDLYRAGKPYLEPARQE